MSGLDINIPWGDKHPMFLINNGPSALLIDEHYEDILKFYLKHKDTFAYPEDYNRPPQAVLDWVCGIPKENPRHDPNQFRELVYETGPCKIWVFGFLHQSLSLLYYRDVVIPELGKDDYVLVPDWGGTQSYHLLKHIFDNAKFKENFIFLSNGETEKEHTSKATGMRAELVSHNAFLPRDTFKILPNWSDKKFKAVINGIRAQKCPELTTDISPMLFILNPISDPKIPKDSTCPMRFKEGTYSNGSFPLPKTWTALTGIPWPRVTRAYNAASCGLTLSQFEGGCFSSTEMLYCGLPVVSRKGLLTPFTDKYSTGGRESYHNDYNSIVLDEPPTPGLVKEAVDELISRNLDPEKIRNDALAVSDRMLKTFKEDILGPILKKYGVLDIEGSFNEIMGPADKRRIPDPKEIYCQMGTTNFHSPKLEFSKELYLDTTCPVAYANGTPFSGYGPAMDGNKELQGLTDWVEYKNGKAVEDK